LSEITDFPLEQIRHRSHDVRYHGITSAEDVMRIAWVGGVESNEKQLEQVARKAGHEIEFHGGHMGGRGEDRMKSSIARCDVVLIVTDVNSHGAVLLAKRIAKQHDRRVLVTKRCGPARFAKLLSEAGLSEALPLAS
jgi:hypothetical protein